MKLQLKENTKFIVITGGVISGIGKGVASASIGALFKDKMKIVPIKCDGYLNTDPGTMNPIEHGEVFVLDDGAEVDMDFGHYERFLDTKATSNCSITMGKVYKTILENERRGVYLGKTVQLIPHVTDEIKKRIYNVANKSKADLILLEIGGTVGDMENELFIESARQIRQHLGASRTMFVHLTYVPKPVGSNEQKSKPTQQSVKMLNQAGIYPDMIIARSEKMVTKAVGEKISLYCNIDKDAVISGIDVDPIYELPLIFEKQGVSNIINKKLNIDFHPNLTRLSHLVNILKKNKSRPNKSVTVALCGKYINLHDSYVSISETLYHVSAEEDIQVKQVLIDSSEINKSTVKDKLKGVDGVIIPGGFGITGIEGKIEVIKYIRENQIPFLGICLGMQLSVVEFARNVCGIEGANTLEIENESFKVKHPVITMLPEQRGLKNLGGTMRLGGQDVEILPDTQARKMYNSDIIRERFRHRYEVNPDYIKDIEEKGLVFSGRAPGREIMQIIEFPQHKFFMGCQFHPELTSKLEKPSTLFLHFLKAILS